MHAVRIRESNVVSSSPQPTVYIVDDDEGMRESLRWLVQSLGVPVKTFGSAEVFLGGYDVQIPGCLVVDVRMPGMSGLDLQRELRRRGDQIPVIVLTGHGNVPTAVEALKHGATEFLEKPVDGQDLLEAIQRSLALDAQRRAERHEHGVVGKRMKRLSRREHEVLGLVVDGLSSKQIAARLSVSGRTVEAHRAKIMKKLEVESVAQLVRTAVSARALHAKV
jgi:FixJ family two-component response regulator